MCIDEIKRGNLSNKNMVTLEAGAERDTANQREKRRGQG